METGAKPPARRNTALAGPFVEFIAHGKDGDATTLVRKHQIIEIARDLITTKGMEGITIEAIADAVSISEGAIYRHFTGKIQKLPRLIDDIETDLQGDGPRRPGGRCFSPGQPGADSPLPPEGF